MNRKQKTNKSRRASHGPPHRPPNTAQAPAQAAAPAPARPPAPAPRRLTREDLAGTRAALDVAALHYDAHRDGGLEVAGTYTDTDGRIHQVCVNYHPVAASWRVIDIASDGSAVLLERMSGGGAEETRGPALAYAVDYAEQWRRFNRGDRDDPPVLPRAFAAAGEDAGEPQANPAAMTMTYREG